MPIAFDPGHMYSEACRLTPQFANRMQAEPAPLGLTGLGLLPQGRADPRLLWQPSDIKLEQDLYAAYFDGLDVLSEGFKGFAQQAVYAGSAQTALVKNGVHQASTR